MADFQEVMNEYHRMCDYYNNRDCQECPLGQCKANESRYYECLEFLNKYPTLAEEQIMRWSREYPKKIYPLVRDVVNKMALKMGYNLRKGNIYEFMDMRLNKAAADYFGIIPINENTLSSQV